MIQKNDHLYCAKLLSNIFFLFYCSGTEFSELFGVVEVSYSFIGYLNVFLRLLFELLLCAMCSLTGGQINIKTKSYWVSGFNRYNHLLMFIFEIQRRGNLFTTSIREISHFNLFIRLKIYIISVKMR